MKNKLNKFFRTILNSKALTIFVALFMFFKLFSYYKENKRLHKELIGKSQEYIQLDEYTASLQIKYIDQEELQEKLKTTFLNATNTLKGRIKVLSNATYLIREKARKEKRSDLVYEGKKTKYLFNEIRFKEGPPIGYVMIFDNGKVVSKIYNHVIDIKSAISRDESKGTYTILSKADFKLRSGHLKHDGVNWFNKPYPLKIIGGTAFVDPTEKSENSRFYLWAPRLSAGFNSGVELGQTFSKPTVGISLMGYGPNKRDLDYKFLHFGVGFGKSEADFDINFVPIYWRPFRNSLPNTYLGLGVGTGINGINYFLGVNFNF